MVTPAHDIPHFKHLSIDLCYLFEPIHQISSYKIRVEIQISKGNGCWAKTKALN